MTCRHHLVRPHLAPRAVCLALAIALGGCTMLMVEPQRPTVSERVGGLTWTQAYEYLERARTNMKAGQSKVDEFNQASLGGVGLGAGGAAATTLARGPADVVLGLLTIGGISYSVNQVSIPQIQGEIYKAGLGRLSCIEQAGSRVSQAHDGTRAALVLQKAGLNRAMSKLSGDLAEAAAAPADALLAAEVKSAGETLRQAGSAQRSVAAYLDATDAPFATYLAVDRAVTELNDQLRLRALKADDVAKLGDTFNAFQQAGQPARAASAPAPSASATVLTQSEHKLAESIHNDALAVNQVVASIHALLPPPGYETAASIRDCFSKLPAQGFFDAHPPGPIHLLAGGDPYTLTIATDAAQLDHAFAGLTPTAQNLLVSNPSGTTYSLAAPAGAREDRYQLFFHRRGDAAQFGPTFEVTVAAPPPPAASAASAAAGTGSHPGRAPAAPAPGASGARAAPAPARTPIPQPPALGASH